MPTETITHVICQGCENECEVVIAFRGGEAICLGGNHCPTGEIFALSQTRRKTMDMEIIMADITTLEVDAIVNAANCGLLGGGGVDGAIHEAAGDELLNECLELVDKLPGNQGKTGEAYLTGAGKLPCKYVIHTPGPVYFGGTNGEPERLANCYRNSLLRAEEKQCESIAFPCISTGVYGYPQEEAAKIAVDTVKAFPAKSLKKVIFCCYLDEDVDIYRKILQG